MQGSSTGNSSNSGSNLNNSPTYAPYNPKGIKKLPSISPSKIQENNNNSNNRSLGLIRPTTTDHSTNSIVIKAPTANRPDLPSNWSNSTSNSNNNSSSSFNNNNSNFSPSRSTPPNSTNSFPYSSVSPGQSPFPPSSPKRIASPAQNQQQQQQPQQKQKQQSTSSTSSLPSSRSNTPKQNGIPNDVGGSGNRTRANYHPSFQPQGVKRDRTDEFLAKRRAKGEGKKLEEGRLGRRMEKVSFIFDHSSRSVSLTLVQ